MKILSKMLSCVIFKKIESTFVKPPVHTTFKFEFWKLYPMLILFDVIYNVFRLCVSPR